VLHPARIKVFVLIAILMHVAFAILFSKVGLSFLPPQSQELSLEIVVQGTGRADIMQTEAAWPMPERTEPSISAETILKSLDEDAQDWAQSGVPDLLYFLPKDAVVPLKKTPELAAEAPDGLPEEFFSYAPAESKPTPMIEFALPPAMAKIFEAD
jgi:hypothetical protein